MMMRSRKMTFSCYLLERKPLAVLLDLSVALVTAQGYLQSASQRYSVRIFTLVIRGVRNPQLNSDAGV